MKSYKAFVQILIAIILLLVMLTVFAQAQSNRKINRDSKETGLYVRATMSDKVADVYNERQIYCEETLVTHFINKRYFIAYSDKFKLDLDVKRRKVGDYNSWLAVDENKNWFFITPFRVPGTDGYGVIIQPVDAKLNRLYDLPTITISNFNVCQ